MVEHVNKTLNKVGLKGDALSTLNVFTPFL